MIFYHKIKIINLLNLPIITPKREGTLYSCEMYRCKNCFIVPERNGLDIYHFKFKFKVILKDQSNM